MPSTSKRKREDGPVEEDEATSRKTKRGRRCRGGKGNKKNGATVPGEADHRQETKRATHEEVNGAVSAVQTVIKTGEQKSKQDEPHRRYQEVVEASHQAHNATRLDSDDVPAQAHHQVADVNGKPTIDQDQASIEPRWTVSQTLGGRLIDGDPIFTNDEKYLILAYPSSINVYALNNSSLVRALPIASSSTEIQVTSYALSATNPSHLYAGTAQGILYHFDWVQGMKLGRWQVGAPIRSVTVTEDTLSRNNADLIYTRDSKSERWWMTAHRLQAVGGNVKPESGTILSLSNPITHSEVVDGGKIIVVASGRKLLVGASYVNTSQSLKELKYIWREVVTPLAITTLDVRVPGSSTSRKKSKQRGLSDVVVDVVIGDIDGVIHVFEDLHNSLVRREKQKDDPPTPRRMHWHRQVVHSVKWSRDGNYIISGGSETVLVLWQLDTDRCQFLPHLSASIDSIVVSPSGTAYAVRLSDNTVMVLSTSELNAKAYIGGIQLRTLLGSQGAAHTHQMQQTKEIHVPTVPATISTLNPSQLLLAAPSTPSDEGCPFLQTVDLATAHHVSRQALTRTNVTTLNIGPERNRLVEPSVTLMQTSHDGRWLATVDEWSPPARDLEALATDEGESHSMSLQRKEIHLKIWSWKEEAKQWELVSRFDGPHDFVDNLAAGRILDLVSDPSSTDFATIGEDYTIRVWGLKTRVREGRDEIKTSSKEWVCRKEIPIRRRKNSVGPVTKKLSSDAANLNAYSQAIARLAYSADGSVLAASQSGLDDNDVAGTVYFIDPRTGKIHRVKTMMYNGSLVALGFVDRYLIAMGSSMKVWDTVTERYMQGLNLVPPGWALSPMQQVGMIHLAIDHKNGTFAVAFPAYNCNRQRRRRGRPTHDEDDDVEEYGGKKDDRGLRQPNYSTLRDARGEVLVLDPTKRRPLHIMSVPHPVTVLLPLVGSREEEAAAGTTGRGYVIVDGAAEMRIIRGSSMAMPTTALSIPDGASKGAMIPEHNNQAETKANGKIKGIDLEASVINTINDGDGIISAETGTQGGRSKPDNNNRNGAGRLEDAEDDETIPVVRQEQLTALFDSAPAYALPPVHDLFERMAEMFSKKPIMVGGGSGGGERQQQVVSSSA